MRGLLREVYAPAPRLCDLSVLFLSIPNRFQAGVCRGILKQTLSMAINSTNTYLTRVWRKFSSQNFHAVET